MAVHESNTPVVPMSKLIEWMLALTLVGAALAFGGAQAGAYSVVVLVLFCAVTLLVIKQSRQGRIRLPLPIWPALFLLWAGLAVVPLPARVIAVLSPSRLAWWKHSPSLADAARWLTVSTDPHGSVVALIKFLAYLSAFVLAAYLFDSRERRSLLWRSLLVLGCFEAGYGIVQYLTNSHKIFGYTKIAYVNDATGTYINHNHFAGLLELVLPLVLASAFYSFQKSFHSPMAKAGHGNIQGGTLLNAPSLFYLFLLAMMGVALVLSRSRAGILAGLFALVFIAILGQIKAMRKGWFLLIVFILTIVIGYGLWIGLGPVLARFERVRGSESFGLEGRPTIWKDTLQVMHEYPVTGTGLGTFGVVFRRYQTDFVSKYVGHAHNDYLEFACETGAVGVALLFVPIIFLFVKMVVSFLNDSHRYRRSILLGCIGSTLALLIHSLTDFNLQMPANALIFAAILGIGYKVACIEPRAEKRALPRPSSEVG